MKDSRARKQRELRRRLYLAWTTCIPKKSPTAVRSLFLLWFPFSFYLLILDLHTRNLAFTIPCLDHLSEEDFCKELGDIRRAEFKRRDGGPLEPGLPKYLVGSAFFPKYLYPLSPSTNIKIVDFGQAFLSKSPPATVCTPIVLRPPEVVFGDPIDYRVDLWSMGCLVSL